MTVVQLMPYPLPASGPTPSTAPYAYDETGRPWSIATSPSALYHGGKAYVAWEAQCQFRHIKIASFDHSTEQRAGPFVIDSHGFEDDDHAVASLVALSDGRLVCFYGSHSTSQYWAISGQSGGVPDITSWTRQTAISGSFTYPKPVNIDAGGGAGTLFLFMRRTDSASDMPFVVRSASYTSGGAVSFGAETEIIELTGRVYASDVRLDSSGNIEFCVTRADGSDTYRRNVYYFRYIVATGAIENLSGSVSTASGSQPINLATADASYRIKNTGTNTTGWVSWCRDGNDYLHILYGDDTTDPWDIKHDWHNGSAWQGETVAFTVDRKGSGGFVEEWALVPVGNDVHAYYPDGGAFSARGGDDIKRKVWSTGSWGSASTIMTKEGASALGSPHAVANAHADFRVMFTEVAQDEIMESLFTARRYFYGDSGFVNWPAPSDADQYRNILVMNFEGANGSTSIEDDGPWGPLHAPNVFGNAQISTSPTAPWGTSWLALDGTGDYLTLPASRSSLPSNGDWKFEGGDTLEIVFRPNATGTKVIAATRKGSSSGGFQLYLNGTTVRFNGYNGSTLALVMETTSTVAVGNNYTVGVKRKTDGTWGLYLNGVEEATGAATAIAGTDVFYVGTYGISNTVVFNGWIKQIRWTKLGDRDLTVVPTGLFPV